MNPTSLWYFCASGWPLARRERSGDPEIKRFARTMADDERRNVELVGAWLERYDPHDPDWAQDLDPPTMSE